MSKRAKEVVIEKDGVRGVATQVTLKGLLKRGWQVVDDKDKEVAKANKANAEEEQKLDAEVEKYFGTEES